MDKLSKITAYVPVSVGERLPDNSGRFVLQHYNGYDMICDFDYFKDQKGRFHQSRHFIKDQNKCHWLDKRENVFVITETELEKLLGDAFCAGEIHGQEVQRKDWYDKIKSPNKVQFINQLINHI